MDNNLSLVAVEMILERLQQNKEIVIYGMGTSMSPTIEDGDALVVSHPENLKVGDIVLLLIQPNRLVAHRLIDMGVKKGVTYVRTKGDNLEIADYRRSINFVKGKVVEIKKTQDHV